MEHYARVLHSLVTDVIVADEAFINNLPKEQGVEWIKTCPCAFEGKLLSNDCDCETPLRMNYASVGGTYDKEIDAFIPPKEYPSWVFDINTCTYIPRIKKPNDDKFWKWNESKLCWETSE